MLGFMAFPDAFPAPLLGHWGTPQPRSCAQLHVPSSRACRKQRRLMGSLSYFQMPLCKSSIARAMEKKGTAGRFVAAWSWERLHEV